MLLGVFASALPNDPVPGSLVNDKIRLVGQTVQDGTIPIVFDPVFAVRDSDGLIRQENTGDLFYVRWTLQVLKGSAVVRTRSKDEPIVPRSTGQLPARTERERAVCRSDPAWIGTAKTKADNLCRALRSNIKSARSLYASCRKTISSTSSARRSRTGSSMRTAAIDYGCRIANGDNGGRSYYCQNQRQRNVAGQRISWTTSP
jgi:hypothetical protein